jgi:hypothetical protein
MPKSNDYLFITDVLTAGEPPAGGARQWGKVVVQVCSRDELDIASVSAIAKLIAINAAAKRWPGIVRLRDSQKLVLEARDCDVNALREPFFEDPLGRAWIVDPGHWKPPKSGDGGPR